MKHLKKFNENFFNRLRHKISLPNFTFKECDKLGYKKEQIPSLSGNLFAFTKDGIKVGDEVFFLGHDGVGGFYHGDKIKADQELVNNSQNLQFYKKVGTVSWK